MSCADYWEYVCPPGGHLYYTCAVRNMGIPRVIFGNPCMHLLIMYKPLQGLRQTCQGVGHSH